MPEMIDIYNENRALTGERVPRKGTFLKKGQYMMYVLALIEDKNGKFIITQRALDKKWAAGAWEIPGGGAQAGESSFEAVCREVLEETGLDVSGMKEEPVYSYFNEDLERGDNYFVDIYHFHMDFAEKDVRYQESEAIGLQLADMDTIRALNEENAFLHYSRILEALDAEK